MLKIYFKKVHETVKLLHIQTPDFILLDLWLPNSLNHNQVDYQILVTMQECVY